ncbi:hypothetical protein Tcan_17650 [Toxocara canis]|uniref:Uncharacterized protein n=1 Tax=Toxocara canis TaxID=6265 RepID=A0A0B2UPB5_TOXCA|nr:hypothetical protein Tcan_17650 [Toxocara canis]
MREVYTTSVPCYMSQIGDQFGFFLGPSIITFIQTMLYGLHYCTSRIFKATHYYLRCISITDQYDMYIPLFSLRRHPSTAVEALIRRPSYNGSAITTLAVM